MTNIVAATGGVVAVTVTYGNRADFCIETITSALRSGANHVILVTNGLAPNVMSTIRVGLGDTTSGAFSVVALDENTGSASGFSAGLAAARARTERWVWLLDDDNQAAPDALVNALEYLQNSSPGGAMAGVMARDSDESHRLMLEGEPVKASFPPPGSFFGFDLLRRTRNFAHARSRRSSRRTRPVSDGSVLRVPQAPYGGLLINRQLVERADPPREDFVLYFDDVEFTRRLVREGESIVFCGNATIHDLGSKWADTERGERYVDAMIASKDWRRIYYSYRNGAFVDLQLARASRRRLRFVVNVFLYSANVLVRSGLSESRFLTMYVRAVRDGLVGRMGRRARVGSVGW